MFASERAPKYRSMVGVPVTVTGSENRTSQPITSPATKAPPAPEPVPVGVTERIPAGVPSGAAAPSTRAAAWFATACVPRPSVAAPVTGFRIVPPFSESAVAAMPIPSASRSAAATV